jgi:hypothetical protein
MDKALDATAEISLAHVGWDPADSRAMGGRSEAGDVLMVVLILILKGQHDTVAEMGGRGVLGMKS